MAERRGPLLRSCGSEREIEMATAVSVDRDRELGRKVLTALTQADIPVSVPSWAFVCRGRKHLQRIH
jgi:hypothetical protein